MPMLTQCACRQASSRDRGFRDQGLAAGSEGKGAFERIIFANVQRVCVHPACLLKLPQLLLATEVGEGI